LLNILYRDDALIAVDKPAGLLVHRSLVDRHERRFAVQLLRDQIGARVYPLHRLDKPTSGVLMFALSPAAARRMGSLFDQQLVRKSYLAVVRGYTAEQACIDYPLREELDRISDVQASADKTAQPAVTDYRRLATLELAVSDGRHPSSRYSLLAVYPLSGRKHQIRRHMKHIFHPIVGDTTHGDGRHNRIFREQLDCARLLLAAAELRFTHPDSGEPIRIRAPLDDAFAAVVARFGWTGDLPEPA
jgi:tRNA pseudouridine65 synthase